MLKTDVLSAVESDVMKIKNQRKKRVVEKQSMELQGNSKEEERNKTAEKKIGIYPGMLIYHITTWNCFIHMCISRLNTEEEEN